MAPSAILRSVTAGDIGSSQPMTVIVPGAPAVGLAVSITAQADGACGTLERASGARPELKEEAMTEQTAQYDHIGSKYDEYAQMATLKRAESYTFFRLLGALQGKSVLDLASGLGFYTRQLKQRGAAQVVGVDISPEMVRLACVKEHEAPTGVEYRVGDATHLPALGHFDLVTAVYLLNYAPSKAQLLGMFRSAYANLAVGGRFVAYTMDPAFTLSKPNATPYGVTVLRQTPGADHYVCDAEFVTDPPTP